MMCQPSGPVTATAAFFKDQVDRAVLDPGDSIGTVVIGTRSIRFGINPTNFGCTEVVFVVLSVG